MLARTCSQFHEPAISVLWQSLNNIVPLLYTLPSDLCVTEAINGNEESSEFVPSKNWVVMVRETYFCPSPSADLR